MVGAKASQLALRFPEKAKQGPVCRPEGPGYECAARPGSGGLRRGSRGRSRQGGTASFLFWSRWFYGWKPTGPLTPWKAAVPKGEPSPGQRP